MNNALHALPLDAAPLLELFRRTRSRGIALIDGLEPEDMTVQSMEDASPTKWHLAHATWFFEEFVLKPNVPGYRSPDERFALLFNSYYVQAGPRFSRDERGTVTRPTVADILDYRAAIEATMEPLIERDALPRDLVELGCHHEMQHQELMLTDLLHALSHNPLRPVYRAPEPLSLVRAEPLSWRSVDGGIVPIGHGAPTFAFDCEAPRHDVLLRPYELASRAVTCGEWIEFIDDGGYDDPTLWLSDGWSEREREAWSAPAYWWKESGSWHAFGLRGAQPVDPDAPVAHVSYSEAEAYARWAGARLPTEAEWEHAAGQVDDGTFLDGGRLRPARASAPGLAQLWGDVWEWTASAYLPYPGFQAPPGAVGEYNGKFMCNQFVLRGGSALTPVDQMRPSYRNFFHPGKRWQMSGLRLARDTASGRGGAETSSMNSSASTGVPSAHGAARPADEAFARSVLDGLSATPKTLEPKWFYDERGSSLFDGITRTAAYYPTRTESAILARHAGEIAAAIGPGAVLLEPGAGSMIKARIVLGALESPARYVPTDISGVHLHAAAASLRGDLPGLDVRPRVLEFDEPLSADAADLVDAPVTVFFPGSTIGNLEPTAAARLLERFATETGARYLLIGVDTPPGEHKGIERLIEAYADPEGITAAFNRNLLVRIDRELGGDFDPALFAHVARYDTERDRIEMHLESTVSQCVHVLGRRFEFERGETIMTEASYKHAAADFERLAAGAGWRPVTRWSDEEDFFAVHLFER